MESLLQDLRYAARVLRKSSGFTAIAVLTLALAIGATTAIFSVVYGVLLRPLPYPEPDRIMAIHEVNTKGTWSRLADPNFDDFRDQNHSFQAIAKYTEYVASVAGGAQPTRSQVAEVSGGFFKVLRAQPVIGRDLTPDDTKKGAAPVALVSYGYWKHYLNSTADLSQLHLKIGNTAYSVVGILPGTFDFPAEAEVWIPADLEGENPSRTSHNFWGIARLKDGVTVEQARDDISAIARRIHDNANDKTDYLLKDGTVVPLQQSLTGKARSALLILLGAVAFLLMVACANVANLMLAQAVGEKPRAGDSQRVRRNPGTAGPAVPYRVVSHCICRRSPRPAGCVRRGRGFDRASPRQSAAPRERLHRPSCARVRLSALHGCRCRIGRVHRAACHLAERACRTRRGWA